MRLEITPKQLYIIGIFCFSVIGIANSVSLILTWSMSVIWGKLASIGGIIFNFAMVGLFNYLLGLEPKVTDEVASDDINEIIKEVSNGKRKRD